MANLPSQQEIQDEYKAGVTRAGAKWARRAKAATGKADKARSDGAEQAYAAAMQAAIANRQRVKGLAGVTDADINAGIDAVGPGGYSSQAAAKASKQARKFEPYRQVLEQAIDALPPRTADPMTNLTQRAGAIVQALANRKRQG